MLRQVDLKERLRPLPQQYEGNMELEYNGECLVPEEQSGECMVQQEGLHVEGDPKFALTFHQITIMTGLLMEIISPYFVLKGDNICY